MGVIDGGISPYLSDWVIDCWDTIAASDADLEHGTFISGLAVAGGALNTSSICQEPDETELIDIAVYPDEKKTTAFASYYPYGVSQFFEEVEYAVADRESPPRGARV